MWLIIFVKKEYSSQVTKIHSNSIAKGVGNFLGNKGGVAKSFMIRNRLFSFIAVHLKHGQNKSDARNEMASQLMREMQLTNLQSQIGGLEIDQIADFSIFMGDLNYRLNTTFEDLNNSNTLEALEMVGTKKE